MEIIELFSRLCHINGIERLMAKNLNWKAPGSYQPETNCTWIGTRIWNKYCFVKISALCVATDGKEYNTVTKEKVHVSI